MAVQQRDLLRLLLLLRLQETAQKVGYGCLLPRCGDQLRELGAGDVLFDLARIDLQLIELLGLEEHFRNFTVF